MRSVRIWTGREARALRLALRFSVRAFAEHLGVAIRTVSKWEAAGGSRQPQPAMQAALDTVLARAAPDALMRFEKLLADPAPICARRPTARWDYESWVDDLDRARLYADRQNFALASRLVERWLGRVASADLDEKGHYLSARSLVLLGDIQRDQGELTGPGSARSAYSKALSVFGELNAEARVGQVELLLTVISEMSGEIEQSARAYLTLADDPRLSLLDRARARLWVGTALTKSRALTEEKAVAAVSAISGAIEELEGLDEPDEWSVGHQKLALANLAAGNPEVAHRSIDIAVAHGRDDSPLQRVRLDTARAHILLADNETRGSGLTLLERSRSLAVKHKLAHQLASIDLLSQRIERPDSEEMGHRW